MGKHCCAPLEILEFIALALLVKIKGVSVQGHQEKRVSSHKGMTACDEPLYLAVEIHTPIE